jgi:hypothetical protein
LAFRGRTSLRRATLGQARLSLVPCDFRAGLGSTLASHRPIKTLYDTSTIRLQQRRIHYTIPTICNPSTVSLQCSTTSPQFHRTALHRSTTLYDTSTVFLRTLHSTSTVFTTTLHDTSKVPLRPSTVSLECSTTRVQFHCNVLQLVCSSIQHVYSSITIITLYNPSTVSL